MKFDEQGIEDLNNTIEQQGELIKQLQRRVDELGPPSLTSDPLGPPTDAPTSSRRAVLRGAGVATAVGFVAVVARPEGGAAAADGGNLILGEVNSTTGGTWLNANDATGIINTNILTASDRVTGSGFPAAIGAYAYGNQVENGVYAYCQDRTDSDTRTGHAIVSYATSTSRSNLLLEGNLGDPTQDSYVHRKGELRAVTDGSLWYCVEEGTPGVWKRIASPDTRSGDELGAEIDLLEPKVDALEPLVDRVQALEDAGSTVATGLSLSLVTPFRVYDSRRDMGTIENGVLPTGSDRVIPVRDARDISTGAVAMTNAVPVGATGVVYNLTLIEPIGAGFLAVGPQSATAVTASTINFRADSPAVQANSSTSLLDGDRELRVIAGGESGSAADFIIDVLGYYS